MLDPLLPQRPAAGEGAAHRPGFDAIRSGVCSCMSLRLGYCWLMETAAVQRRTLRLLFVTQIISGIGVSVGASVGALLAAEIAGVGLSGLSQSASVVGAALFAIPATALVQRYGRRPSLASGYFVAAIG